MAVKDYIRERFFPHIWCPGCGHGMVLKGMLKAVEKLGIDKNNIAMVSGIGCSSRITGYVDFHTLHTIHGRALAFATGVKLSRPELCLIVPMGDGDALAIGGNHFIHACRRNIDITAIIMNNRIYGMTGGQYSPLSGVGKYASTAPYSTIENNFDITKLAEASGAAFVARTTTYHMREMIDILCMAIKHKGFSVVEIFSQCPTYFGRKNELKTPTAMLNYFKDTTTSIGSKAKENNSELIERGVFINKEMPEYCEEYDKIIEKANNTLTDAEV